MMSAQEVVVVEGKACEGKADEAAAEDAVDGAASNFEAKSADAGATADAAGSAGGGGGDGDSAAESALLERLEDFFLSNPAFTGGVGAFFGSPVVKAFELVALEADQPHGPVAQKKRIH